MKNYLDCFKREKTIYKIITVCLVAFFLYFLTMVINNSIDGLSYPKERYEVVNARYTQSILDGNNPFVNRPKAEYGTEPPVVYEYAFVSGFITALFSLFVGGKVLLAHYIVSFLAMVGSGILGFLIVKKYCETTVAPLFCFVLQLFCHWRYGYISSAPDSLGLFLTLLVLFLATRDELKHKELLCSIGLILIFYTKQYLVGICFSLFLYFWIQSHKSAWKLLVYCCILTPLSVALVALFLPCYWDYSVLFLMLGSHGKTILDGLKYVLEQFLYLSFVFSGLYVVLVFWLIKNFSRTDDIKVKTWESKLVLFVINIFVQVLVLIYFARNDGAYLTYFLQMLFPSVIVVASVGLEKIEWTKVRWINILICSIIIVFTVYFGWHKLPMHSLSLDEKEDWEQTYELINEYRNDGKILHYYPTALDGLNHGDSLFQTGHDTCLNEKNYEEWRNSSVYRKLFPSAGIIMEEEFEYQEYVKDMIKKHKIAMVAKPNHNDWYITDSLLTESGYFLVEEDDLVVGNMTYPTEFWAYK